MDLVHAADVPAAVTAGESVASSRPRSLSVTYVALILILGTALLLRLIHLDADPPALISRDFITDEGWWAHNARNAALYGQWRIDDHNLGLYSAFLYNALVLGAFKLFGVALFALRLPPALTGWLTVAVLFLLVRREVNSRAALFATALLGLSNLHIMYSRTGFPESTVAFFLALALWFWFLKEGRPLFAVAAGICFVLMVLAKITAVYFLPGVLFVAVSGAVRHSITRRQALLFVCGILMAGAAYAGLAVVPNFHDWLNFNLLNGSGSEWPTGLTALIGAVLKLLGSSFYAKEPLIAALGLLALGGLAVGFARDGVRETIRRGSELEVTAAALLVGYVMMLAVTVYQPERRFIPVLFLLVILSAVLVDKGSGLLAQLGGPDQKMGTMGWFTVLFLLPVVGILEIRPEMAGSIGLGWSWALKAVCVVVFVLLAYAMSRGRWPYRFRKPMMTVSRLIFITLFSVLLFAVVVRALALWGFGAPEWKSALAGDLKSPAIGLIMAVAFIGLLVGCLWAGPRFRAWLLLVFLSSEAVQISAWLLQPTYTMRETTASLASLLGQKDAVVTFYETLMVSSAGQAICKSPRRLLNLDVYERFKPRYTLVLRRDNWKDYAMESMPIEEWPPPPNLFGTLVARYDLCPAQPRGPRFIAEFYRLEERPAASGVGNDQTSTAARLHCSRRTAIGSSRDALRAGRYPAIPATVASNPAAITNVTRSVGFTP